MAPSREMTSPWPDRLRTMKFVFLAVAAALTMVAVYLATLGTETHTVLGDSQRIFYFHVPSAWVGYLGFGITFVASVAFLRSGRRIWDDVAGAAAEVGVVFTTMAILSGPIWARADWGVFWRWEDMKLFMTLVLFLVFLSYLALRSSIANVEQRARLSAVVGIVGFAMVPMSFAANRIWNQFHPTVVATSQGSLGASRAMALVVAVFAFTFLFASIVIYRIELARAAARLDEMKEELGGDYDG